MADQTTSTTGGGVSAETDTLDALVEKASVPDLATLFKRGKEAGLIVPSKEYGGST